MKIFVETYGCAMNFADTEIVKTVLAKENFAFVTDEHEADIVMLNTCAIRENAHRKVYGRIHNIRHQREERSLPNPLFGILGCMSTNLRQDLLDDRSLKIDFIAGPDSYKRLPDLIRQAAETGKQAYDVTLSEFETYSDIYPTHAQGVNSWVSVMRGCNNFCTFCVVPYTRGRERSRSLENIVEEARRLAAEGFKQVTLLGQNVNSYRSENFDFADLLEAVAGVKGIERIRFTSPHPKDFPEKLLKVMVENPKVCKQIHLPLQAGNNRILDAMNRTYTREEFLALVAKVRALHPAMAVTTDIIVGFPTETREEFEDTVKVVTEVEFDSAYMFKYSERKGTAASKKWPDDVSGDEKTERIIRLNTIQTNITLKKNQAEVGKTLQVLLEDPTEPSDTIIVGRTDSGKLVILPKANLKSGQFVDVLIHSATPHALKACLPAGRGHAVPVPAA